MTEFTPHMKRFNFLLLLAILPLMGCEHTTSEILHISHELGRSIVQIGEQSWNVEVAKTPEQRQQGLMLREKLEPSAGMLFVFEEEDFHAFWMKNTLIPLDVIWIGEDLKVVDVQTLTPCVAEECLNFRPSEKAKYVLEVAAGTFKGLVSDELLFVE
jgi:uncharacterized membrane protein (UPF0127 family)